MRFKSFLAATGMLAMLAAFLATPAFAQSGETPICANCHEQQHTSIMLTAHGAKNDAAGSMCQACHGDASDHVKDPMKNRPANPFGKGKSTAAQKDAVCMTCHAGGRHLAFWESGKHVKNEVTCANCHSIHGKPRNPSVTPYTTTSRPLESDICGSCHQQIRSAILKPSHHPITEGKIKCSDCHNPHGALSQAMVRQESVNDQCKSCHADKRGPFVFSHPPVEDNCLTCHNPHGSSHAKLLNENTPNLCQDCHDVARHPGTPYGQGAGWLCTNVPNPANPNCKTEGAYNPSVNTRFIARACNNCHNAIHGSNAPANRGQFLIR